MPMLEPMTELDAVNEMLVSIGQAPVSTLTVTGIKDVNIAKQRLASTTRRVLTKGYWFNTDDDYKVQPDADGIILVPVGAIRIKSVSDDLIARRHPEKGMAVYDRAKQSFEFTASVALRVVWAFPFEDLPETARTYIATSAARRFQATIVGSPILDRYEEEDVMSAWMMLEREERANRKTNLFRSNATIAGFGSRSY